jgi:hypothetical protein
VAEVRHPARDRDVAQVAAAVDEFRLGEPGVVEIIRQGLMVAGWVAMWRPMEIFLYAGWPVVGDRGLYDRLSRMPVRVEMVPGNT